MIRPCTVDDLPAMEAIVNAAAQAYRGAIPDDCWHEPYMSRAELEAELAAGVRFSGYQDASGLVGVMGLQRVDDATLIRHAYVRPGKQRAGIGTALLDALVAQGEGALLVGTWAAAHWAIRFYERHGFRRVDAAERDRLLSTYWKIPDRQREASVVLVHSRPAPGRP